MSLTDDELRVLVAARPEDFVRARNDLVRALRKEGRRDDADALAVRRRPTAIAWALNRVAHDRADLLDQWFTATTRLRDAMHGAVRGDADGVRAAQSAERSANDAVVAAARGQLGELGQANTEAAASRIAGTVRAAALDDEVAQRLRQGTLETDVVASGFGFAEMAVDETRAGTEARRKTAPTTRASRPPKSLERASSDDPAARKAAERKRAADEKAQEKALAAERASQQAEVARLTTVAARLSTTADKAQRKVDDLKAQAEQLSERLRSAEREARAARQESERASAAADRARVRRDQ